MSEAAAPNPSRKRLVTFWVLAVVFVVLAIMPRPFMLPWLVTLWAGDAGDMRSHELHGVVNSLILYATILAVAFHIRRPAGQVGALWALAVIGVLPLIPLVALGGVPAEFVPIVSVIFVLGVVVFFAHPAPLRDKLPSLGSPSPALLGLAALVAIPLVVFAAGQYSLFIQDIAGDEHREFGHWLAMGSLAISIAVMAFITGTRVPGFRIAGWFTAVPLAVYAVASLVLPAVHGPATASTWSTPWAVAALLWAGAFAFAVEREAARSIDVTDARVLEPATS